VTDKIGWLEALGGYRVHEKRGGLFGGSDQQIFAIDPMVGISYSWTRLGLRDDDFHMTFHGPILGLAFRI